jgi:hypothetical protein
MTHEFKGIDYSELHLALGIKYEDDMDVDLLESKMGWVR